MIGELVRLLIAAACFLFVLSLPLWKTQSGATLRRWAGVCFVLALLPSMVGGLFYSQGGAPAAADGATASSSPANDFLTNLGCMAAVVIVAFTAYGILKLRSRLASNSKPRDTWETFFNRGGGKRAFTMHPNPTRSRGPFSFANDDEDDE